jgi:hypothetical protein
VGGGLGVAEVPRLDVGDGPGWFAPSVWPGVAGAISSGGSWVSSTPCMPLPVPSWDFTMEGEAVGVAVLPGDVGSASDLQPASNNNPIVKSSKEWGFILTIGLICDAAT